MKEALSRLALASLTHSWLCFAFLAGVPPGCARAKDAKEFGLGIDTAPLLKWADETA
jgi:hypothetical protein